MQLARLLHGVLLVLALAATAWLAFWLPRSPLLAVAGALLIGLVHAPVMAAEFALLRRINRNDPAPPASRGELLRAWAGEVASALVVFGWRQPFAWRCHPDTVDTARPGQRGVLLVHGFVCNRGLWNPWWPRLQAAGVPCIALNLEPVFGSIERYAPRIDAAVQRLRQATGQPPLLVGHSMGGLAIRAWMQEGAADERVHGVVTIGTPHGGTWLGRFGYAPNAWQMRLSSRWLRALAAAEPPARRARFTCFFSHCDNIVFPASTATLPGADNRHLRGTAHLHLVQHPAVFDEVLRRLRD